MSSAYVIHADFYQTDREGRALEMPSSYLLVRDGRVVSLTTSRPDVSDATFLDWSGLLVIPGLTDLHVHASQYQFRGLWMDEELLEWLNAHTFPEEAKYKEISYASQAYRIFTDDLLHSATTRAAIFATIHEDSTLLLARYLEEAGIAAYVGKVNMDRNSVPELTEDSEASVMSTLSFIEKMKDFKNVKPIITPRFIPSCSDWLLDELARIAKERGLPVQSHLSENQSEGEWVHSLCPESVSYADAYRRHGLWGGVPTIMAHCVYSMEAEPGLMRNEDIFVAHCPDSNTNLSSGIAPARWFLENGVNMGLGSDVAGGTTLSILRAITDAVKVSKLRWRLVDQRFRPLSFREAFHIASRGGGAFFGGVGGFDGGMEADLVALDDSVRKTAIKDLSLEERLERHAYLAPEEPVTHKMVKGRLLF